jgi:hypothetical protein
VTVELDAGPLRAAALRDIIRSKMAANPPRDRAVLPVLERPCMRKRRKSDSARRRRAQLDALRRESERDLREQILRLLEQPMSERTHFLRVRLPGGGSAL